MAFEYQEEMAGYLYVPRMSISRCNARTRLFREYPSCSNSIALVQISFIAYHLLLHRYVFKSVNSTALRRVTAHINYEVTHNPQNTLHNAGTDSTECLSLHKSVQSPLPNLPAKRSGTSDHRYLTGTNTCLCHPQSLNSSSSILVTGSESWRPSSSLLIVHISHPRHR